MVALTATASPPVRDDIIARLRLRDPEVVVSGLDRPNLFLEVAHCPDRGLPVAAAARAAERRRRGPASSTCRPGAPPRSWPTRLTDAGYPAQYYHGGMAAGARAELHEAFLADQVPIMVATSAFGMGIDKPNIAWVVAHGAARLAGQLLPGDRPGRPRRRTGPGAAAVAGRGRRACNGSSAAACRTSTSCATWPRCCAGRPATKTELRETTGLGPRKLGQYLALLEQVGAAEPRAKQRIGAPRYSPAPGGRRRGGPGRGRAAADGDPVPYRHDAGLRRDHRLPGADAAGVLR